MTETQLNTLNKRERHIVKLMCDGIFGAQRIAKYLELRPNTVASYITDLMAKLKVHDRAELVVGILSNPRLKAVVNEWSI